MNANICQIRLDLEHFSVSGPEPLNHVCNTDQFLVSGGSPVPILCGNAHGEHSNYNRIFKLYLETHWNLLKSQLISVYIDAGVGDSNPIMLTLITSGSPFPRMWRIRISQIECTSIAKADTGCLQFYTGVYGQMKSFNFDANVGSQLSNQDYSICIRTERNFCSIQYTACKDAMSKFLLIWTNIFGIIIFFE